MGHPRTLSGTKKHPSPYLLPRGSIVTSKETLSAATGKKRKLHLHRKNELRSAAVCHRTGSRALLLPQGPQGSLQGPNAMTSQRRVARIEIIM
jgi:hypothetical protein